MSPSPTTARRGWLDSDAFYGDAMTQFSHLARREDLLQRKRCRYLRKSTDLDHDKRTTESGCRSRSEFNRGPAMLGTSRAGHRPLSHRRTVLVRSQNRRTNWCNAMSTLDITDPSILSRPADLYADPLSDKGLQRADGCGRLVLSGSENGTRIEDVFERSPIRIMFPRTGSRPVEEAVLINTGGGIAGGDQLECSVAALPDASIAVTSQAAEKVYLALYEPARVVTRLKAEESAKLAWLPQETIVFNRARLQDGRLIWADSFRITDEIFPHVTRKALLANCKAVATLIYFGPYLEKRLDFLREIIPSLGCNCAVTLVSGLIVVRFAAEESSDLKLALRSFLQQFGPELGSGPFQVPKMWSC